MDTVYFRYFGQVVKLKSVDYQNFIDHLVEFRKMEGIKDKYPPDTMSWLKGEFDIDLIEYPMDGSFRAYADHRNGGVFSIVSAEELEELRNKRIAELNKGQRKKFDRAEKLADDSQPMLEYLDLELLHEFDPRRVIEPKLPCNDNLIVDYEDMKYLGYRDGDKHTEKMARQIQFWKTYALSKIPDDREVKKKKKLKKREPVLNGKGGGRKPKYEISIEQVDAAIESAIKKIKLPTSKKTPINNGTVFSAVAEEVKVLTGASEGTFNGRLEGLGISRDYIYEKMPNNIR